VYGNIRLRSIIVSMLVRDGSFDIICFHHPIAFMRGIADSLFICRLAWGSCQGAQSRKHFDCCNSSLAGIVLCYAVLSAERVAYAHITYHFYNPAYRRACII